MILLTEDLPADKDKRAEALQERQAETSEEPPPSYTTATPTDGNQSTTQPLDSAATSSNKAKSPRPTNFVSMSRANSSVKGTWTIDVSLVIPASLLPPLAPGETEESRKNVSLESKNSSVDADITIAPFPSMEAAKTLRNKRVVLSARSSNGSVTAKVHAPNALNRPSFFLTAYSSNGSVHVHLPRTFHGPLVLKTANGHIKYSPDVQATLTTLNEVDRTHRAFIGVLDTYGGEGEWTGDELVLESRNGSVKVYYDDEVTPTPSRFFGRLFGRG